MNPQKLKDWVQKISLANLQKPAQNAALSALTTQTQQLSLLIQTQLAHHEHHLTQKEETINTKTSQLVSVEARTMEGYYGMLERVRKEKETREGVGRNQVEKLGDFGEALQKKGRAIHLKMQHKNKNYLQLLQDQLHTLQSLRKKTHQTLSQKHKTYQHFLLISQQKANKLLECQQKDLTLIEQYQKQLLTRVDQIQQEYLQKLQHQEEVSKGKQNLLLRRLQGLISDVDVDFL